MKDALEKEIEKECCDWAFRKGWFECKLTSPSRRGFPDRFYARYRFNENTPPESWRRVVLVEYKRPGEEPTEQQAKLHRELARHGVDVHWIVSLEQAKRIFA